MRFSHFFLLILFFTIGCKSTQNGLSLKGEVKNISDSRLLRQVQTSYIPFETLFVKKFTADYSVNQSKRSFGGSLFIRRDKELVVTVTPLLGIELFRAHLTLDSVFLLDRTKRKLHVASYDWIENMLFFDANLAIIQRILTNQMFVVSEEGLFEENLKRFKHYTSGENYFLNSVKSNRLQRGWRRQNLLHSFEIIPDYYKVKQVHLKDFDGDLELRITYEDFKEVKGLLFPSRIQLKGKKGMDTFEVNLQFHQLEWDGSTTIGFQKPERYETIIQR